VATATSWAEGKSKALCIQFRLYLLLTLFSLVLNPKAKSYRKLKDTWDSDYVDNQWAEDSIFLERNSRDFVSRIDRIGTNAEAICDVLSAHPRGKS
jgi:cystathionine beta-lyase/cystathionine gamma-synthase